MTPATAPDRTTVEPTSLGELFVTFNWLALQGFGGVLAIAQRELVERKHWLTNEQFLETLAIAQVLPGPNVVNLSLMFGDRCFGLRGALTALAGLLALPLVIVLSLAVAYAEFAGIAIVAGALRGVGAVAAGLVIATAVKLLLTLRTNRLGPGLCVALTALTVVTIAWLRWPMIWVVGGLGPVAVALAWRRLER